MSLYRQITELTWKLIWLTVPDHKQVHTMEKHQKLWINFKPIEDTETLTSICSKFFFFWILNISFAAKTQCRHLLLAFFPTCLFLESDGWHLITFSEKHKILFSFVLIDYCRIFINPFIFYLLEGWTVRVRDVWHSERRNLIGSYCASWNCRYWMGVWWGEQTLQPARLL